MPDLIAYLDELFSVFIDPFPCLFFHGCRVYLVWVVFNIYLGAAACRGVGGSWCFYGVLVVKTRVFDGVLC